MNRNLYSSSITIHFNIFHVRLCFESYSATNFAYKNHVLSPQFFRIGSQAVMVIEKSPDVLNLPCLFEGQWTEPI